MKGDPSMRDLLAITRSWGRQWPWLLAGLLVSLGAVAAGVALLNRSGQTVAAALVTGVIAAPVVLHVLGGARVVGRYAERVLTHAATFRALADLRVWFFRGLSRRAAGGLGFRRSGDVLSRLANDVDALDGLYLRIAVPAAGALLLLPVLTILIGRQSFVLAVALGALFAAAAIAIPVQSARASLRGAGALAAAASALRVAALDLLGGLREARAFGAEDRLLATVQAREVAHQSALDRLGRRAAMAQAAAFLCAQAALLVVLVVATGHRWANPVGAVSAVFLTVGAFEAVALLPRAGALAGHAAASAQRVRSAAAGPLTDAAPKTPEPLPECTSLRFESVGFAWLADRPCVFRSMSLDIPQGARVAVLGPSGSGKSTLAALALRVAIPQAGRVLLGGTDIAKLRPEDVRRRISWLSQATHLFDDTLRANLLLARPDAAPGELWDALEAARLAELVRALPDGLETRVGEGGAKFSGGQARRLVLARALLSHAPVLILDEPCAGLDGQTEQEFLATLNEVAGDRSVLLIVHRLTGVERLDRIYRLSGGHAVAAAA